MPNAERLIRIPHSKFRIPNLFSYLLQGITLGFSAAVSPGPFQAYLLAQTTTHGWKKTAPAAFAPLLSDGPIIVVVVLILARTPDWFLRALNLAGGIFLLYLAYCAYRTFKNFSSEPPPMSAGKNILRAAMTNALSPAPWLFWTVLAGPLLVEAWEQSVGSALAFLFGFYALLIGGNVLFIFLFATTRRFGPNVTRALNGIAAVALLLFGLLQIWRGIFGA
jgi:threonine/homoserine/homoserine lactone efflux protein